MRALITVKMINTYRDGEVYLNAGTREASCADAQEAFYLVSLSLSLSLFTQVPTLAGAQSPGVSTLLEKTGATSAQTL